MKAIWLGQAGLFLNICKKNVLVDPYFSNSVEKINPKNFRRVSANEDFYKIRPDIIVLTHDHLDHTDPETLEVFLKNYSGITVLASKNAWNTARAFGGDHNYVMFNRQTVWSEYGIKFRGIKAEHSDDFAVGVVIEGEGKKVYITGDTLYNEEVFADLESDEKNIDALFLPINGVGNNMNMKDAAKFAERVGAKKVVPIHFGMFDELDPTEFECENKIIPKIYKEMDL